MRRARYGNNKVKNADGTFDSKIEYQRFKFLEQKQSFGKIRDLKRQVVFTLLPCQKKDKKVLYRGIKYVADFTYIHDGELVVEDVKSSITEKDPVFVIKQKLMYFIHGIEIKVVKTWNE